MGLEDVSSRTHQRRWILNIIDFLSGLAAVSRRGCGGVAVKRRGCGPGPPGRRRAGGSVTTVQSVIARPAEVPPKNNGYCAHPANAARGVARRASCAGKHTRAVRKCCIIHCPT